MNKRINTTEAVSKTIRDTAPALRRIEPRDVAKSIGAETSGASLEDALAPVTLFALREELLLLTLSARAIASQSSGPGSPLGRELASCLASKGQ